MVLDPRYRDVDRTTEDCHQRVLGMLSEDRVNIAVTLPAEPSIRKALDQHTTTIDEIQKGLEENQTSHENLQTSQTKTQIDLEKIQAILTKNQIELADSRVKISELRVGVSKLQTDLKQDSTTLEELMDRAKRQDRLRFLAFKANVMTGFVKKLSRSFLPMASLGPLTFCFTPDDRTKYKNAACKLFEKFTAEEFKERTGLDPAYRVFLGNYGKFIGARREWGHETDEELAHLLLSRHIQEEPFKTKENVEQWEKLLLWVTGKESLEEIADGAAKI